MEIIKDLNQISDELTLVDFFANWCGPCKMLSPILEDIKENKICDVKKIDVDESLDIARTFQISSIPTMILFKDKKALSMKVGYMEYDEIVSWINQYK